MAESADVALPGEPPRERRAAPTQPEIPWDPNRIWIWDCAHFTRCKRHVYAIVDVVPRYWIGWLSTTEQSRTQVQLLLIEALARGCSTARADRSARGASRSPH